MAAISLNVNFETRILEIDPGTPLLWVLRDVLNLKGTKYSCGKGLCGSCTVHLDGKAIQSCQTTVGEAADRDVLTIEGLSQTVDHPLQQAWLAENVSQCGYCQAGQIMQAAALLTNYPTPDQNQINQAMSGVLCRCGTYQRIQNAILRAIGEV